MRFASITTRRTSATNCVDLGKNDKSLYRNSAEAFVNWRLPAAGYFSGEVVALPTIYDD